MFKADTNTLTRLLVGAAMASTLTLGLASAASASTDTTEPPDSMADHGTMASTDTPPVTLTADGSAEATSPEAEAFCTAAVATEAAFYGGDPAAIGSASEGLTAAAPADIAETAEQLVATAENPDSPEFLEAYRALIDYMKSNCGFSELEVVGSDYAFGGVPAELPAGPIIVTLENIGEELHVIEFARVNDDVTLTAEELFALPEEEALAMITLVGAAFAAPGDTGYGIVDLAPGRYLAVCPLPQGLTPEVAAQLEEEGPPEGSGPAGSEPMGSEPMGSEPMGTEPMSSAPEGSAPEGSASEGSGPGGPELGPPHFILGMYQEITVT